MHDRRNSELLYSAIEEDMGLFKSGVVDVRIDVSPMRRTTSRGDLLCVGYLKDVEIEVVFPGRRRRDTGPLEAELDRALKNRTKEALSKNRPMPVPMHVRYPLRAHGTWRTRLLGLEEDKVERRYQLLVANWMIRDAAGLEKNLAKHQSARRHSSLSERNAGPELGPAI